jgi:hypothetical protein
VLRHGYRRSLFGPLADQPPDFAVQLHLGQIFRYDSIYSVKKFAIVDIFSNVHGDLLSGAERLFLKQGKGLKRLSCRPSPLP